MPKVRVTQKSKTQYDNLCPVQDSGSLAVFKVTASDQSHHKGPSGAFVTYCNISCFFTKNANVKKKFLERGGGGERGGGARVNDLFTKNLNLK